jgi:GAF domain-containing protein
VFLLIVQYNQAIAMAMAAAKMRFNHGNSKKVHKDRILGISQVINRLDGGPFTPEGAETLTLLSTHAAIAIEDAQLHRALLRRQQIDPDLTSDLRLPAIRQRGPALLVEHINNLLCVRSCRGMFVTLL